LLAAEKGKEATYADDPAITRPVQCAVSRLRVRQVDHAVHQRAGDNDGRLGFLVLSAAVGRADVIGATPTSSRSAELLYEPSELGLPW